MAYVLKIHTALTFERLDTLLGQHCRYDYSISLGGLTSSPSSAKKVVICRFSDRLDRERVRSLFQARGARQTPAAKDQEIGQGKAGLQRTAANDAMGTPPKPSGSGRFLGFFGRKRAS